MQQPSGGFRLIVRRGPQPNQIYELNKDITTIGRDITNDITINDPEVSRHHARLTREGNSYNLEDLGSTNGTFVNGQRISGTHPLSAGETIGLGETVTLAYESTAIAGAPQQQPQPQQPQQQPQPQQAPPQAGYAPPQQEGPPPPQQPSEPQASPYAPPGSAQPYYDQPPAYYGEQQPPSPYNAYAGYEEEAGGSNMTRFLLLGCGCFIVLCVIGAVVALIVIDQTCAWDQEPLASILELVGLGADSTFQACQ